jgi:hypothetical protein
MAIELFDKAQSLSLLLISRATGKDADDSAYKSMRAELIAIPRLKTYLPESVRICRSLDEFWEFIKPKFKHYAERKSYIRSDFEPLLQTLEMEASSPGDVGMSAIMMAMDSGYVQETWRKALDRRATDAEGAITAARTLLETVCKHILDSAGESYDDAAELPKLYSQTATHLNLSPSQHSEQLFKQVLGGCQTVVAGLGAIRNRHSDAHGKGSSGLKPAPRHAELAVNLAGAMATFLLQTWEARRK